MRCLTLAEELRNAGAEVQFVTRAHEGNLNGLIEAKGFALCVLPAGQQTGSSIDASSPNESWLGTYPGAGCRGRHRLPEGLKA